MSLIKPNQHRLWAIAASALFHLLLLLFLFLESKQIAGPDEPVTPEMMMQLEALEQLLDEPTPVLADDKGEKEAATNQTTTPEPKAEEQQMLPMQPLMATERIDTVAIVRPEERIAETLTPPPVEEKDSVMKDLKEIIQKTTGERDKRLVAQIDQEFIRKNYKTIQNLRKVFAFAKKAREMKERLDKQLLTIHDSGERRRAIKAMEKEVWTSFESAARQMTTSQGRLLLKLLARETGQTGYDIVKEYKGAIPAVFWQGVAVMFRQNLKSTYDSLGEDAVLEAIVKKYERKEIK